ncbi:MAG: hypothetical protein NTY09_14185 [bacterium]|nr:hypothetical protein [bacterium]
MMPNFRILFLSAIIMSVFSGCAGHNSQPVTPDEIVQQPALSDNTSGNGHYLLNYGLVYIDAENPDDPIIEIIPVREGEIHLNILKFLEKGPCFDCFKIVGLNFPEPGVFNLAIQIDHPFDDLTYSVFDVRGILMFEGSRLYSVAGKWASDPALGDGTLLNPDGFTALYNGSTMSAPVGDLQKYLPGNLSAPSIPNSNINGYKYFTTDNPANNRNAFFAGSSDVQTYTIKLPDGPFVLGYAVDANWWIPTSNPVTNPLIEFDINANCPEPWKIVVTEEPIGEGLTFVGGQTKLLIDVYDWQGKSTYYNPIVECPELFDGVLTASWVSDGTGFGRYEVTIPNAHWQPIGNYTCLIGVMAHENDPINAPWMDLTAYQTIDVEVHTSGGGNLFWAKGIQGDVWGNSGCITTLSDDTIVVTAYYEGKTTFNEDEPTETNIGSSDDDQGIFLARYNPDGEIVWAKSVASGNAIPYGVISLSDDSIIVTGHINDPYIEGDSPVFGFGEPNEKLLVSYGSSDIFIARYYSDGSLAWVKQAGGIYEDNSAAITVLSDDSVVIVGSFTDTAIFALGEANETILIGDPYYYSYSDFFARYNIDGSLTWAKLAGCTGNAITALPDGSFVVTGGFSDTVILGSGEPNETTLISAGSIDIFLAKYIPDATLAWAINAGGQYGDEGNAVTAISGNSIVVTGYFSGSAIFGKGEVNQTIMDSFGPDDIFLAQFNQDGSLAWAKHDGGTLDSKGSGITALSDNSAVITGYFNGVVTFGAGEPNQTGMQSAGQEDICVARRNSDASLAWARRAGGPNYEYAGDMGLGITALSDDSVVVTGVYTGNATFGPGEPNQTVLHGPWYSRYLFVARYHE